MWCNPNIQLELSELSAEEGYFHERLAEGHRQLVRRWQERAISLTPQFAHTDILGAILIAAQVFAQTPPGRKKVLILFSDMRQSTHVVDLENPSTVERKRAAALVQKQGATPNLGGVHVYALGVDANGVSTEYWQRLQDIWLTYFQQTGAIMEAYSVMRTTPGLEAR